MSRDLEADVREWGGKVFDLMAAAGPASFFETKGLQGSLMAWVMRDERFKTRLFRFVDVLPALRSAEEIARHLKEYLDDDQVRLAAGLRAGLSAAAAMPWLVSSGIRKQVAQLARQFMLGPGEKEIAAALQRLNDRGVAFTLDVLGEAVVSEAEADDYARRYLELMAMLARQMAQWPPCTSNLSPRGQAPALNLSVKISALYSQIHPADPETAIERISARLRPILRAAREHGALINFDMEHHGLKDLTLRLFREIFSEEEFASLPACGLALQAYLKESEADLAGIIHWARSRRRRVTVRLVKGAYWDYERVVAGQKNWPEPVLGLKAETDASFEKLSVMLLENGDVVDAAFGTHNVRSIAHVLAQAERRGIDRGSFEFQMLYGMAEPVKATLRELGCRLREYCPVGELLPGVAYLVRRLLENTSNEGFLANHFSKGASRELLMKSPHEMAAALGKQRAILESRPAEPGTFRNEPPTDFTVAAARQKMHAAIQEARRRLGQRHPLIIGHQAISTRHWRASLNPANQGEVIGYAAQATVAEAETALAAARAAQKQWAQTPASGRASILERTAELMRREKTALSAVEILEAGKTWIEADADVAEAIDFCNFYAAEMRNLGRPKRTQPAPGESNFQEWRPRGVGVIIAPWNFPLAILTGMASAAMVAGNAVLLKPSNETPIIASRLMQLLMEAGLPPGVANLVTGPGGTVAAHLAAHPDVDFVAFTGSKEAGLKIWETAGRTLPGQANLKKVVCELGGKNCVIVDSDADLDEAVAGCLASAFGYQGQKCSALSRLVVLADNYDRFMERFVAAADSLRAGPAEIPGNIIGPVISREAQSRLLAVIEAGRKEAKLAWQGRVPGDANACYVPPVIFTGVSPGGRLFREEIFGPVLAVARVKNFDEALALANTGEFALTGGCYSRSPAHIARAKTEMICGNLYINRGITGAIVERQPFGGHRMSGGGTKAGGHEYLQNFLVPRVVTENRLRHGFVPIDENDQ